MPPHTGQKKSWRNGWQKTRCRDFARYLEENGYAAGEELKEIELSVENEVQQAIDFAEKSELPDEADAVTDVYSDLVEEGRAR
nr:thiamine pyrophosphate-dependent enzyme [Biomaibacter acetigenes]